MAPFQTYMALHWLCMQRFKYHNSWCLTLPFLPHSTTAPKCHNNQICRRWPQLQEIQVCFDVLIHKSKLIVTLGQRSPQLPHKLPIQELQRILQIWLQREHCLPRMVYRQQTPACYLERVTITAELRDCGVESRVHRRWRWWRHSGSRGFLWWTRKIFCNVRIHPCIRLSLQVWIGVSRLAVTRCYGVRDSFVL